MIRVAALVEGPTERNFCQQILAAHLGSHGVEFHPRVVGKPGHKGGNLWPKARREMVNLMRGSFAYCTTMFDLYALPKDWPGRKEARAKGLKGVEAALAIEQALEADIAEAMGTKAGEGFFAYLSLHEYEALLFSDPEKLAGVTMGAKDAERFAAVVAECGGCEEINDRPETAPSKRILKIAPGYKKTSDGPVAAQRIGLATMRVKCQHFDGWVRRLEKFGEGR